jgi:hypothetical protein
MFWIACNERQPERHGKMISYGAHFKNTPLGGNRNIGSPILEARAAHKDEINRS